MDKIYFITFENKDRKLEQVFDFNTLESAYQYIIEQELVVGTYKLYKAERLINENF